MFNLEFSAHFVQNKKKQFTHYHAALKVINPIDAVQVLHILQQVLHNFQKTF